MERSLKLATPRNSNWSPTVPSLAGLIISSIAHTMALALWTFAPWSAASAQSSRTIEGGKQTDTPYQTELIVRTVNNLRGHTDVVALLDMAARHGVTLINLAAKQDEDDELPSGVVFYASAIAPQAKGYETFDALQEVIVEAHRRGIMVHALVPQFHDQMAVRKSPAWQMQAYVGGHVVPFSGGKGGEYFINPLSPAVQSYERSIVSEIVRNYDVDGIVLDWLRFDDYNMDVGPETQAQFKDAFGYELLSIDFSTNNERRTQWNAWRGAQIGNYARSVRQAIDDEKPGLPLGVYMLPPDFIEVGQDVAQFSRSVTFLSPMAYFRDWGYAPSWVYRNVLPATLAKSNGTALVPVFDTDWNNDAYREILPNIRRAFPEITTLSWFVYGEWTEKTFQRISMLRAW
jgi:hypothetical protein